jgi:hypothetical protein
VEKDAREGVRPLQWTRTQCNQARQATQADAPFRFSLPQSRVRQPAGPGASDLAVDEPSRTERDAPCAFLFCIIIIPLSAIREAALFKVKLNQEASMLTVTGGRPARGVRGGPTTARRAIILPLNNTN